MGSDNTAKKESLRTQLKEVEVKLKTLQEWFNDIKKRATKSTSSARQRGTDRRLGELRKELGLK